MKRKEGKGCSITCTCKLHTLFYFNFVLHIIYIATFQSTSDDESSIFGGPGQF